MCCCVKPIGVCGLITPWNGPDGQITSLVPALPADVHACLNRQNTPVAAAIYAEIIHAALPAGVFNLVHGDGPTVGNGAISDTPTSDADVVHRSSQAQPSPRMRPIRSNASRWN
jgi:acyl-CoA reductase-like NAD-dependent aldehyde dehydrogenase